MRANKDSGARPVQEAALSNSTAVTRRKNHLYVLQDGMIYTAYSITSRLTSRYAACVLVSLEGQDFELTVDGEAHHHRVLAVRPLLERSLRCDSRFVSLQIFPTHPLFRRFRAIPNPGFLTLPPETFAELQESLLKAADGRLKVEQAYELFEGVIDRALPHLPMGKRNDPRIERALQVLRVNPTYPLTELAPKLQISSDHLSRLFAQVVGLPWRSYMLWQKVRAAAILIGKGFKLTEAAIRAGFVDSAHLSKTWQQAFGASPSYFFFSDCVRVVHDPHLLDGDTVEVDDQALGLTKGNVCRHCGSVLSE